MAGGAIRPSVWPGPRRRALLIGGEAHGLPAEVVAAADLRITIPMPGGTESLNAAMAGAILAYRTGSRSHQKPRFRRRTNLPAHGTIRPTPRHPAARRSIVWAPSTTSRTSLRSKSEVVGQGSADHGGPPRSQDCPPEDARTSGGPSTRSRRRSTQLEARRAELAERPTRTRLAESTSTSPCRAGRPPGAPIIW